MAPPSSSSSSTSSSSSSPSQPPPSLPTTRFQIPKDKDRDKKGSNRPISFRKLMALKTVGDDVFESLTPAWPPAPLRRAFGGHVYAQAVYAASRTVGGGLVVHQVTGHFILPGAIDIPYVYRVRRLRDGGIYSLRSVDVYQASEAAGGGASPCFVATVSFKRGESAVAKWVPFQYSNVSPDHIRREYADVLRGLNPEDHPDAPGADALWWEEEEAEFWSRDAKPFPGVETLKVDMAKYNGHVELGGGKDGEGEGHGVSRWRQLLFYRLILDDDDDDDEIEHGDESQVAKTDLNLHAAAHLYASDRNSLFLIQRAMGYARVPTTMASLSHTVVFHGGADTLSMVDPQTGRPKWFVQESWTSHGGDNRACHNSLLWDYGSESYGSGDRGLQGVGAEMTEQRQARGRVIATTVQDGMMRFPTEGVKNVYHAPRGPRGVADKKAGSKL